VSWIGGEEIYDLHLLVGWIGRDNEVVWSDRDDFVIFEEVHGQVLVDGARKSRGEVRLRGSSRGRFVFLRDKQQNILSLPDNQRQVIRGDRQLSALSLAEVVDAIRAIYKTKAEFLAPKSTPRLIE
jgi:hypothetical protein